MSVASLRASPWWRLTDAFWRALAYCLLPRVIWLSLAPLLLSMVVLGGAGWWGWTPANEALSQALEQWGWSQSALSWLDSQGWSSLRSALVPLMLVGVTVPLVVMLCLLAVGAMVAPAMAALVKARRFPAMRAHSGVPIWRAVLMSVAWTALAMAVLIVSLPLWLFPPVALVLPPLIWGWLTYRVMTLDVLADWATADELSALMRQHRGPLLVMGLTSGYLGAAPALLWAIGGVMALALAPVLLVLSIWVYTLVFVVSALWFAHYLMAALHEHRGGVEVVDVVEFEGQAT